MTFYRSNLPTYPTVSWGSRKNERWSSKIHYSNGDHTLCGIKIPKIHPAGDSWDMCERCARIAEANSK